MLKLQNANAVFGKVHLGQVIDGVNRAVCGATLSHDKSTRATHKAVTCLSCQAFEVALVHELGTLRERAQGLGQRAMTNAERDWDAALKADIERLGRDRDDLEAANAKLRERLDGIGIERNKAIDRAYAAEAEVKRLKAPKQSRNQAFWATQTAAPPKCSNCNGNGEVIGDYPYGMPCPNCHGRG